jgi:hypothetical protein
MGIVKPIPNWENGKFSPIHTPYYFCSLINHPTLCGWDA